MITWRARAHQQCDFVLLLTYQTNRVIPEHAGALKTARRAGIGKTVTPHTLRHALITAALDAGVPPARRARSRLPCRPTRHDPVRPGPGQPGPARHLRRRRIYRGRRQVIRTSCQLRQAATAARRSWRTVRFQQPKRMAHGGYGPRPEVSVNRRSARRSAALRPLEELTGSGCSACR